MFNKNSLNISNIFSNINYREVIRRAIKLILLMLVLYLSLTTTNKLEKKEIYQIISINIILYCIIDLFFPTINIKKN